MPSVLTTRTVPRCVGAAAPWRLALHHVALRPSSIREQHAPTGHTEGARLPRACTQQDELHAIGARREATPTLHTRPPTVLGNNARGHAFMNAFSMARRQSGLRLPQRIVGRSSTPPLLVAAPSTSFPRHARRGVYVDPNQNQLAVKSTATLAVERSESKIYTMQQYFDKEEMESGANKTLVEKLEQKTANPSWLLWCLGAMGVATAFFITCTRIRRERIKFDPMMRKVKSFDLPGGPQIGGPFSLEDVNGKRWTDQDFKGKWLYIYFGFTNCPDICPQEMSKMSRLINHLDKKVGADYWQPLFISIDAKRDSKEKVKEYLRDFHPRILGLTGTPDECEAAAREFRVYFAVPDDYDPDAKDYLVDHSIVMYLMDPEGKFSDYTTKEFTWHESYTKLLRRMIDYERSRPAEVANLRVANSVSTSPSSDMKRPVAAEAVGGADTSKKANAAQ